MPKRQKRALIFIFALGFFAVATSIVRLHSVIQISNSTDMTYDNAKTATWSSGELNISLIYANAPAMRPLLVRLMPRLLTGSTQQSSQGQIELSRTGWRTLTTPRRTFDRGGPIDTSRSDPTVKTASEDELPLQSKCWAAERLPEGDGGSEIDHGGIKFCTEVTRESEGGSVSDEGCSQLLLDRRSDDIEVTEAIILAAIWNRSDSLQLLLNRRGKDVDITEAIVVAAARERPDALRLLLDRRGDDIKITEAIVAAAAARSESDTFEFLLDKRGDDIEITEAIVLAATQGGFNSLKLLLNRHSDNIEVTEVIILAII
ncbi:hypothetical protein ACJZ2D_004942 [Fusarium nematophilum]